MSDTKNTGDKTLHVAPKTLTLKRSTEQGVVRQSFSHGRTKAVVVEKVRRGVIGSPGEAKPEPAPAPAAAPSRSAAPPPAAPPPAARVAPAAAPAARIPAPSPA